MNLSELPFKRSIAKVSQITHLVATGATVPLILGVAFVTV